MTLRHDNLPTIEAGAHAAAPTEEWRAAHPPLVTVQVWLGLGGETMTHVVWHSSIEAEPDVLCKPFEEMLQAAAGLHSTADRLIRALATAMQYWNALQTMTDTDKQHGN